MSPKYFGQFLVDRGLITTEQLLTALAHQDAGDLAKLAVAKGYLTPDDVQTVNKSQKKKGSDFGETALKMDLLTQPQLDYLSFVQMGNSTRLGEILIERGFLDLDILTYVAGEYRREHQQLSIKGQPLPKEFAGRNDIVALINATESMLLDIGVKPFQIFPPSNFSGRITLRELSARIEYTGDTDGIYVLSLDRSLAVVIAGQVFTKATLCADEILYDSIAELCNLIAGIAATSLSARGHRLELTPPKFLTPHTPFGLVLGGVRWQLQTPFGAGEIVME